MQLRIIGGNSNPLLAEEIAKRAGINLTRTTIKRFKNGEIYVKIEESVRGDDVFVIQSTCNPVNDNLMELLIMVDALKRASAARITAVIPQFGYARQDRKAEAREPISAKLVANMLTVAGCHRILTVDLHVPQIQGFFDIPVDEVSAIPLFAEYFIEKIREEKLSDLVIVAPDIGAAKRARMLAKRLDCPIAVVDKRRTAHNEAEVVNIIGDVTNKTAIIIDDIIDTGTTIINTATAIAAQAKEVHLCATHPVFSDGCVNRIMQSGVNSVIVANTSPVEENEKIKVISLGKLLCDVIYDVHTNKSVSELFDHRENRFGESMEYNKKLPL